ncbi:MAG TPA: 30S ribosomal protein S16 [Candidatus Dormibacteraeota bacterium]|nr:30S ribosomal protein S16 [Candidatus Dormibacteraeota bacterium]
MAVHIRLRRTGTTRKPAYRVVVADSRAARDGKFIEVLGHYNPLTNPPTIKIEVEKAQAWIAKGAQPSNTVKHLLARARAAAGAVKA